MMSRRRSCSVLMFGFVAAMVMLSVGGALSQEPMPTETQAAMRGLFVVLSNVYRYSLDPVAFEAPKNHQEIESLLYALAQGADQLGQHGGGLDPSFDFMRRSLARDAHDALESFKSANYMGSRYVLGEITQNCVTCHTKRPAQTSFESGKDFLTAVNAESFPPAARARLQVVSRQFSDAMKTYEDVLRSPDITADDLSAFNVFENYLRISIGAMNDTKRPAATFQEFLRRKDMPEALKTDVRGWIASLEALKLDAPQGGELAAAQKMVEDAKKKSRALSDDSQMVNFIGSIVLLHQYLRTKPQNAVNVSEAYYLLGVSEAYVSHSYWISETDYFLESSIRLAPKSESAKQALAFLEDYRRSSHSSVPARAVPQGQTDIEELRKLTKQ